MALSSAAPPSVVSVPTGESGGFACVGTSKRTVGEWTVGGVGILELFPLATQVRHASPDRGMRVSLQVFLAMIKELLPETPKRTTPPPQCCNWWCLLFVSIRPIYEYKPICIVYWHSYAVAKNYARMR